MAVAAPPGPGPQHVNAAEDGDHGEGVESVGGPTMVWRKSGVTANVA